uniref:Uncharacterized protein n=1 Tax=Amphimedon queenslandica TaxID=400682 RepID=A0A1X7SQ65_AMPQE
MNVDCQFFKEHLKNGLPYKYVVYSPKVRKVGHQFEYLHGAPNENPRKNRVLKVPQEKLKEEGYYRQFDTMILPQVKARTSRNVVRKVWDYMWKSESEDTITVPTPAVMRSQCMDIHLQPIKNILIEGKFGSEYNIQRAIDGCVALFKYNGQKELNFLRSMITTPEA